MNGQSNSKIVLKIVQVSVHTPHFHHLRHVHHYFWLPTTSQASEPIPQIMITLSYLCQQRPIYEKFHAQFIHTCMPTFPVKPGVLVHTYNPRTWETEAGGS
jgi:hypothetical protein